MFEKSRILEKKVLPQAAKLPGTSGVFKRKVRLFRKSSAPGSEAARDKWLVQKSAICEKKFCPQAATLPGTSGLFKQKTLISERKSATGSEAARDKWLVQKKSDS